MAALSSYLHTRGTGDTTYSSPYNWSSDEGYTMKIRPYYEKELNNYTDNTYTSIITNNKYFIEEKPSSYFNTIYRSFEEKITGDLWTKTTATDNYISFDAQSETASTWKAIPATRAPIDPAVRIREMMRLRQAPIIVVPRSRDFVQRHIDDPREIRARETLRRVLGEAKFRQFVTKGFVTVKAESGLVYQIFPGHEMTRVYDNGKLIEQQCVVLQGNFTPTDSIIMRFLLLINDEQEFRKRAILHSATGFTARSPVTAAIDSRPLPEIMAEIRAGKMVA